MSKPDSLASSKVSYSTQQYLDIAEIKENTLIMRDGSIRGVFMISSINFALKSEDEQNALVSAYVSFLNNLDFPLQIVIQSRELDMDGYLKRLKQKEKEQINELLKVQIRDHLNYLKELISLGKIMTKRFYAIVPYNPASDKHKGFTQSLLEAFKPASLIRLQEEYFLNTRKKLSMRMENVQSGLASIGLSAVELDTQSLIELFYNTYNPASTKTEKLAKIEEMRVEK